MFHDSASSRCSMRCVLRYVNYIYTHTLVIVFPVPYKRKKFVPLYSYSVRYVCAARCASSPWPAAILSHNRIYERFHVRRRALLTLKPNVKGPLQPFALTCTHTHTYRCIYVGVNELYCVLPIFFCAQTSEKWSLPHSCAIGAHPSGCLRSFTAHYVQTGSNLWKSDSSFIFSVRQVGINYYCSIVIFVVGVVAVVVVIVVGISARYCCCYFWLYCFENVCFVSMYEYIFLCGYVSCVLFVYMCQFVGVLCFSLSLSLVLWMGWLVKLTWLMLLTYAFVIRSVK